MSVVRIICTAILLQRAKIDLLSLVTVTTVPAFLSILPLFFIVEYSSLIENLQTSPTAGLDLSVVLAINFTAVVYNIVTLILLRYTSAHYFTIVANIKSVSLILVSLYVFNVQITKMNLFGLILSISGFCAYTYFRFNNLEEIKTVPAPPTVVNSNAIELDVFANDTEKEDNDKV